MWTTSQTVQTVVDDLLNQCHPHYRNKTLGNWPVLTRNPTYRAFKTFATEINDFTFVHLDCLFEGRIVVMSCHYHVVRVMGIYIQIGSNMPLAQDWRCA